MKTKQHKHKRLKHEPLISAAYTTRIFIFEENTTATKSNKNTNTPTNNHKQHKQQTYNQQ